MRDGIDYADMGKKKERGSPSGTGLGQKGGSSKPRGIGTAEKGNTPGGLVKDNSFREVADQSGW